jgi:hypothetical protein
VEGYLLGRKKDVDFNIKMGINNAKTTDKQPDRIISDQKTGEILGAAWQYSNKNSGKLYYAGKIKLSECEFGFFINQISKEKQKPKGPKSLFSLKIDDEIKIPVAKKEESDEMEF